MQANPSVTAYEKKFCLIILTIMPFKRIYLGMGAIIWLLIGLSGLWFFAVFDTESEAELIARATQNAQAESDISVCLACHGFAASARGVGPSLHNIVGRTAGTSTGFDYSEAMRSSRIVWTPENLRAFLQAPQQMVPGSKMIMEGLSERQAAAVVTLLENR